ncbi:hypothetical protein ABW20_dc0107821 [Dactylellina cionopaga]|nr:hypothetical protein ABW20_dc0107821 [Dactylellina cionopaga]
MAFTTMAWAIAVANLVGSLLSIFGSGFIAITYLILPLKRHFRHSLILNLAIADLLSSTNNSVSGLWRVINKRDLPKSPGCIASGFIEQISIQGTDTSIFAIAIVTVWSLTRENTIRESLPRRTTFLICAATWILPITTACTVLGINKYSPVSGNWCWIAVKPTYLRYVMMHGWRFVFIIGEIIMYTYLHFYLRRRFAEIMRLSSLNSEESGRDMLQDDLGSPRSDGPDTPHFASLGPGEIQTIGEAGDIESGGGGGGQDWNNYSFGEKRGTDDYGVVTTIASTKEVPPAPVALRVSKKYRRLRFSFSHPFAHRSKEDDDLMDRDDDQGRIRINITLRSRRIRRVLLLNAYPSMYILLWIPGIVNRLVEASGHSSPVTQLLQATTQFVGLANAITYGWNERVGTQLKERIEEWRSNSEIRETRRSVDDIG